jgi:sigma-B regulation protein RsbU (phosphoserine phosphatase)
VEPIGATGFPVGLLSSGPYSLDRVSLAAGDTLFLYTDGLTEASDRDRVEYGPERLSRLLHKNRGLAPDHLAAACLRELAGFQAGSPRGDDLTIMVVRRTG